MSLIGCGLHLWLRCRLHISIAWHFCFPTHSQVNVARNSNCFISNALPRHALTWPCLPALVAYSCPLHRCWQYECFPGTVEAGQSLFLHVSLHDVSCHFEGSWFNRNWGLFKRKSLSLCLPGQSRSFASALVWPMEPGASQKRDWDEAYNDIKRLKDYKFQHANRRSGLSMFFKCLFSQDYTPTSIIFKTSSFWCITPMHHM